MSLSDKIIDPPKELTCLCGKCDLSKIRTVHVKLAVKELKERIEKLKRPSYELMLEKIIDEIFGDLAK